MTTKKLFIDVPDYDHIQRQARCHSPGVQLLSNSMLRHLWLFPMSPSAKLESTFTQSQVARKQCTSGNVTSTEPAIDTLLPVLMAYLRSVAGTMAASTAVMPNESMSVSRFLSVRRKRTAKLLSGGAAAGMSAPMRFSIVSSKWIVFVNPYRSMIIGSMIRATGVGSAKTCRRLTTLSIYKDTDCECVFCESDLFA